MCRPLPRSLNAGPVNVAVTVAAAGVLILLATSGPVVTGAPGTGWIGLGHPERGAGAFLRDAGLSGADGLPRFPDDLTEITYCRTDQPCRTGPYPPATSVSFGILPGYTGEVALHVTMGGRSAEAFTCEVPGNCPVLATGSATAAPFHLTGVPRPGTTGGYVLWVAYG